MIRPTDLHAEHHAPDSIGIGESQPRLSWRFDQGEPDWKQVACTLEIRWSNGQTSSTSTESPQSRLVRWPFRALRSCERCSVRVRVVGAEKQGPSPWSNWVIIETGILNSNEWKCSLIEPVGDLVPERPIVFHSSFRCKSSVTSARLYASAHGIYDARINGVGVSDQVLAPGWTSYRHRLLYQTYDVTELVKTRDSNLVEVTVAEGWYCGRIGFNGGRKNIYGHSVGLVAQLLIHYIDGTCETYGTESQGWQWSYGPHCSASLYDGEIYDARITVPTADLWQSVRSSPAPKTLTAPDGAPVRRMKELNVTSIIKTPSGKTVLDFGQNFAGWVRVRIHSSTPCEIVLRHAEVLENDELGTRPLRQAQATDTLIIPARKSILWEPKFTFHGFRYVQIDGWPGNVPTSAVTGIAIHTALERTGEFKCSNDLLNKLHQNIVWSMRSNFLSIPTDCPQRDERLGWTGDINVFADTANYLFDTAGMLTSWLKDVAAEQTQSQGVVALTVPNVMPGLDSEPHAIWGDVAVMLPWAMYTAFGDRELLARHHDSMTAWIQCITRRSNGLWDYTSDWKLGDWLDPQSPPDDPGDSTTDPVLVSDAFLVHVHQLMGQVCEALRLDDESSRWRAECARLQQAFHEEYITPAGRLAADTQTAYALALCFSLHDTPQQVDKAAERLDYLVRRRSRFRIATGFAGTPYLGHAMTKCGLSNIFYRMLLNRDCPSWLYPVTMGATTMWERWDSMLPSGQGNPGEMTSFNHYALGSVGSWMHRNIIGLSPLEPGWSKFAVQPIPGGGLDWAEGSYLSAYGTCRVRWEIRRARTFWMRVEIPPNTTAEVTLPGRNLGETLGSGCHEREGVYVPPAWPPRAIYARFANRDDGLDAI
ncbi:glycoside hydrolase family 78 protein [Zasmidium cellare ATCC 36951]|uniref:alpha-L-rhamnosidase n=1 Tax=Zasmidium cellare ATCC 36951 TaxID=1080233 RepID=A0A6A6CTM2_ZASCE|nr:glycoside hydrolase family 78 protein [Zasmidium cellare ATCC 36951]KAF2169510.1 glycoside hydrolase family 78 protein [Zasmidium cellare ATCC 36951]